MPIQILESWAERGIIWNAILNFCAMLDRIVFSVFGWIMQGIFDIANTEVISGAVYEDFRMRVYVILGIFMLFKVTFSLLTYLVSPDKISDKERGMGKMVTRTIIVIIMLAGLPSLFNLLDRAQPILLEALPRVIIGKNTGDTIDTNNGQTVSQSTVNQANDIADVISWSVFQLSLNEETVNLMKDNNINTVEGATAVITEPETNNNAEYKYFYLPLIGTVVGVIMSFLMVGFAIDVAIRTFKLVILKMIAPIPIISYIDPKSAKDGAFSNWTKTFISTWIDLFLRLGILYFVLYMIDLVILRGNISIGQNNFLRTAVVTIFLIIGLLFFARQAPKFISDALGIKSSKGLGIGLGGALAAGGAFLGGAGIAGALMAGTSAMNENADAAAQGKAGTASWGKGRDLAAQLRTGDKNAKAGLTNRMQDRFNVASSNRLARRLGLSAENVANLKQNMYNKKQELTDAQNKLQEYQAGVDSGKYRYDSRTMEELQKNISTAALNAQKAESAYNDAKAGRESIVSKNGTRDDYSKGMLGRGTYRARVNNPHKGKKLEKDGNTTNKWSRPKPKDTDYNKVSYTDLDNVDLPTNTTTNNSNSNNTSSNSGVHPDGGGRRPGSDEYDDE